MPTQPLTSLPSVCDKVCKSSIDVETEREKLDGRAEEWKKLQEVEEARQEEKVNKGKKRKKGRINSAEAQAKMVS